MGLVDSAHARQSLDQYHDSNHADVDLEEIAKKRIAGGGMVDSVANMANSILGAGMYSRVLSSHESLLLNLLVGIIGKVKELVLKIGSTKSRPSVCS